jgi:hypothetical protein
MKKSSFRTSDAVITITRIQKYKTIPKNSGSRLAPHTTALGRDDELQTTKGTYLTFQLPPSLIRIRSPPPLLVVAYCGHGWLLTGCHLPVYAKAATRHALSLKILDSRSNLLIFDLARFMAFDCGIRIAPRWNDTYDGFCPAKFQPD